MKRTEFLKVAAVVSAAPWLDNLLRGADRLARIAPDETTITTGPGYFERGDIVRISSTGEALQVTGIEHTRTGLKLTVRRGLGSVRPRRVSRGDQLVIVGNAAFEGASLKRRDWYPRTARVD